jgi:hypothetical protein
VEKRTKSRKEADNADQFKNRNRIHLKDGVARTRDRNAR